MEGKQSEDSVMSGVRIEFEFSNNDTFHICVFTSVIR